MISMISMIISMISMINISGKKPCKIDETNSIDDDREIVRLILDKYKNYPSILAIMQNTERTFQTFSFNEVSTKDVWLQLKMLDGRNPLVWTKSHQNLFVWPMMN